MAGDLKAVAEMLEWIRTAKPTDMQAGTELAARRVADDAQRVLSELQALKKGPGETRAAVINLADAVGILRAALNSPEAWGGLPLVLNAAFLLGAAHVQGIEAARRAAARRKGGLRGRTDSKAENIRLAVIERPDASSEAIAQKVGADARHVRRVKSKLPPKKPGS